MSSQTDTTAVAIITAVRNYSINELLEGRVPTQSQVRGVAYAAACKAEPRLGWMTNCGELDALVTDTLAGFTF